MIDLTKKCDTLVYMTFQITLCIQIQCKLQTMIYDEEAWVYNNEQNYVEDSQGGRTIAIIS